MSPSAAVANWDGTRLTVWSHTQGGFELRGAIATALDLPESQIRCIHVEGAGCYGQNGADDAGLDAAMIAIFFEPTGSALHHGRLLQRRTFRNPSSAEYPRGHETPPFAQIRTGSHPRSTP